MSTPDTIPSKIAPDAVADRLADEDVFLLDVRNEEDFEEWSISGSHNVPIYDELLEEDFSGLEARLDELPADEEIVVVCVEGITSARAATFLSERGFDARSMTDGMDGWGRVHQRFAVDGAGGVTQVVRPGTGCVSYVVEDRGEAVVVDPSQFVGEYTAIAEERGLDVVGVVDTHAHADHVSGGRALADAVDAPYYVPEADSGDLEAYTPLTPGESLTVGDRELDVLATPGHTDGSVCLQFDSVLLSGDTLFVDSVGRPDLADSDEDAVREAARDLYDSLERLADLPDDTLVLPAHFSDEDRRPVETSLYAAARHNDLFGMDDEERFVDTIVAGLSETPANHEEIKAINLGRASAGEDSVELELGPNNCAAG